MPPRAKKRTATTESLNMEEYRIGNGYDVHALKEGLPMWLCGVRIESETGFVAHSDGAAALGDIGLHFPDNDDRWKGVDSKLLLKEVMSMVRAKGYELGNADITIALQAPKLRPHIDAMRSKLAEVIGTDIDNISVKATTTERLGFVGRKEGCEVWATVLIFKI